MAIQLGKGGDLGLNGSLEEFDFEFLPISKSNIYTTQTLELFHNYPFERLIIAQAIFENLDVISSDEVFDKYPIKQALVKLSSMKIAISSCYIRFLRNLAFSYRIQ